MVKFYIEHFLADKDAFRDVDFQCLQCNVHVTKTALSQLDRDRYLKILEEMEGEHYPLCDNCAYKLFVMYEMSKIMTMAGEIFS